MDTFSVFIYGFSYFPIFQLITVDTVFKEALIPPNERVVL